MLLRVTGYVRCMHAQEKRAPSTTTCGSHDIGCEKKMPFFIIGPVALRCVSWSCLEEEEGKESCRIFTVATLRSTMYSILVLLFSVLKSFMFIRLEGNGLLFATPLSLRSQYETFNTFFFLLDLSYWRGWGRAAERLTVLRGCCFFGQVHSIGWAVTSVGPPLPLPPTLEHVNSCPAEWFLRTTCGVVVGRGKGEEE